MFILAWVTKVGDELVDLFKVNEDLDYLQDYYLTITRDENLHSASIFGQCLQSTGYETVKTAPPINSPAEKISLSVDANRIEVLQTKARLIAEDIEKLRDYMGGNWEPLSELLGMSASAIPDMFRAIKWGEHLHDAFNKLDGVYLYDAGVYDTAFDAWLKYSLTCVSNDFGGLRGHSWDTIDSILGVAQDSIKAVMMDDVHACYLRDGIECSQSDVIEIISTEHGGE